jgi:imidazolonepropionase-like amidohydrolase
MGFGGWIGARVTRPLLAWTLITASPPHLLTSQSLFAQSPVTAIRTGVLIDGLGGAPVRGAVILVRDGRIEAVGADVRVPQGARVVDLSRYTVLPGFIDMHVHLAGRPIGEGDWVNAGVRESAADAAIFGVRNARLTIEAGFTTVRNVGASGFADVALRNAIEAGRVPGPRMITAGNSIGATGGHCDDNGYAPGVLRESGPAEGVANGPEEARAAVRLQVKYGADVIKICATGGVLSQGDAVGARQMDDDELAAVVRAAHLAERRVAAHAHGREGIIAAARAGVHSIEHGSFLDEEGARVMLEHSTWLVPTLMAGFTVGQGESNAALPAWAAGKGRAAWEAMQRGIRVATAAGVPIAFGTDAGVFPHGRNAQEFELLVRYGGLTPMQAIQTATLNAARLLGREEDVGTAQPGRFADLVAVEGDPLADIAVLRTGVRVVIKGGAIVRQP